MYYAAGQPISGSAKMMYEQAKENRVFHKDKIPMAGDLVFFDNTLDRNKMDVATINQHLLPLLNL